MSSKFGDADKKQPNYDPRQHAMLMYCSYKSDTFLWNYYCSENKEDILLEGAHLERTHLEEALFRYAHLEGAHIEGANLKGADLWAAHLEGAALRGTHLECSNIGLAHLEGANLSDAKIKYANLLGAHLEGANLSDARLEGASLSNARLERAALWRTQIQSTSFFFAEVDQKTIFIGCDYDQATDFTGVGLDSARVEPSLKEGLLGSLRYIQWQRRFKERPWWIAPFVNWPMRVFWWFSDYGRSTGRLLVWFFICAILFAGIYLYYGQVDIRVHSFNWTEFSQNKNHNPGIIDQLFTIHGPETNCTPEFLETHKVLIGWRALYFSVVTMITLGFSDMHAVPDRIEGHIVLMAQVIIGYVLLGALVARVAIMLSGTAPAKAPDNSYLRKMRRRKIKEWIKRQIKRFIGLKEK